MVCMARVAVYALPGLFQSLCVPYLIRHPLVSEWHTTPFLGAPSVAAC